MPNIGEGKDCIYSTGPLGKSQCSWWPVHACLYSEWFFLRACESVFPLLQSSSVWVSTDVTYPLEHAPSVWGSSQMFVRLTAEKLPVRTSAVVNTHLGEYVSNKEHLELISRPVFVFLCSFRPFYMI